MQVEQAPWLHYVIPIVVVGGLMAWRLRRMRSARRLRLETLWILPAIYAGVVVAVFATSPPGMAGWGWSALALAIGAAIGWYRGGTMRISVNPQTHALSQQASPASMLLLFGLLAVKMGTRAEFGGGYDPHHGAALATDIAMAFALGLIAATRIEMAIRARRLLADARAVTAPPS
jgi:hypothetical protein